MACIWDWHRVAEGWQSKRGVQQGNCDFSPEIYISVISRLCVWKSNLYSDPSSLHILTQINKTIPFKSNQASGDKKRNIITTLRDSKIKPQGQDYQPEIFLSLGHCCPPWASHSPHLWTKWHCASSPAWFCFHSLWLQLLCHSWTWEQETERARW